MRALELTTAASCHTEFTSHILLMTSQCHPAAAEGAKLSTIYSSITLPISLAIAGHSTLDWTHDIYKPKWTLNPEARDAFRTTFWKGTPEQLRLYVRLLSCWSCGVHRIGFQNLNINTCLKMVCERAWNMWAKMLLRQTMQTSGLVNIHIRMYIYIYIWESYIREPHGGTSSVEYIAGWATNN